MKARHTGALTTDDVLTQATGSRRPWAHGSRPTIAQVVAEGRSNPEVAEALFISRHTVEAHLTRIYRSLGIKRRTELARALASSSESGQESHPSEDDDRHG